MRNKRNADEGAKVLAVALVIIFIIFVVQRIAELLF